MPIQSGLEVTFNTVAAAYDKYRPTYPDALYRDVFAYLDTPIGAQTRAVEIGIGTGQATRPILDTGCAVTAIELGDAMAAFAAKKFAAYPGFSVVNLPFQAYECAENTCDLVFSASAVHWIDEVTGYTKVFSMLRPGGVFARFANHPYRDKGRPGLHEAMQSVYAVYMPGSAPGGEYSAQMAAERAAIAVKYGFCDIDSRIYRRTRAFTAEEYIGLLGTYSDHIAIEESRRRRFFSELREVIASFGGITVYDTVDLQLARKPHTPRLSCR